MKIKRVYQSEGVCDPYTVVFNVRTSGRYLCLSLSQNPSHPQGVSQMGECILGDHLGQPIAFGDLPAVVREHVRERMTE